MFGVGVGIGPAVAEAMAGKVALAVASWARELVGRKRLTIINNQNIKIV